MTQEFEKGRYSGPFSRAEVENRFGPFQISPLSMVPRAGKPGKFRLAQNLSFPRKNKMKSMETPPRMGHEPLEHLVG